MRVIANKSFVSRLGGQTYRVAQDDELLLPDGADWLLCGLVRPAGPEAATLTPAETATKPRPRKRVTK